MITRRRALARAATVAAGATALSGTARAFSVTEPNAELRQQYEAACRTRSRHAKLVAEIRRSLAGNDGTPPSEADVRRAAAAIRCPLCGCPVSAGLPDGTIGDDRQG